MKEHCESLPIWVVLMYSFVHVMFNQEELLKEMLDKKAFLCKPPWVDWTVLKAIIRMLRPPKAIIRMLRPPKGAPVPRSPLPHFFDILWRVWGEGGREGGKILLGDFWGSPRLTKLRETGAF